MTKKQTRQDDRCMVVTIRHVATPDAVERLSRAVNILLKPAAKSTIAEEGRLPRHTPRKEGLTDSKLSEAVKGQQDV